MGDGGEVGGKTSEPVKVRMVWTGSNGLGVVRGGGERDMFFLLEGTEGRVCVWGGVGGSSDGGSSGVVVGYGTMKGGYVRRICWNGERYNRRADGSWRCDKYSYNKSGR